MRALTPHLRTIDQVYQKVLRERYRTWHAKDSVHKADHFYNFCITAHSLRDYFIAQKGLARDSEIRRKHRAERGELHTAWDANELLRAVREIANSAKHFSLRRPPQTKETRATTGSAVKVYTDGDALHSVMAEIPDFVVTLASGEEFHLFELMSGVIEYWQEFLSTAGVRLGDDPHYFPDETR